MKILIAPEKFKGSLSAREIAALLNDEISDNLPDATIVEIPVADGGDGSLEILVTQGYSMRSVLAKDALGREHSIDYGFRDSDRSAFIEMARICGLASIQPNELDPWSATSEGLGEVILEAIAEGALRIILSIGGSASIDGGAGVLQALGARLMDVHGEEISGSLRSLLSIHKVEFEGLDPRLAAVDFEILADVANPLIGPNGAVRIYGQQKGLDPSDFSIADDALRSWSSVLGASSWNEYPGIGAAGGVALPLMALLDAKLRSGTDFFIETLHLERAISECDVVITGEGSLDQQSFMGKIVGWIISTSLTAGKEVFAIVGIAQGEFGLESGHLLELTQIAGDQRQSIENPKPFLKEAIRQILLKLRSS